MTAAELHIGDSACILELADAPLSKRLAEMGCVPGTLIRLEFKAPAGDPMAFNVEGYMLGLRKSEAALITVEVQKNA